MNGRVYYNEHDPAAAAWLGELIRAGHLPAGEIDTRSIVDVRPADLRGLGGMSKAVRRGLVHSEGNASGLGAHGRSGREPTPSPATCNFARYAKHHFSRTQVCELNPEPCSLHTTRTPSGHSGSPAGIGANCCQVPVFSLSVAGIVALGRGCGDAIPAPFSRCALGGKNPNKLVFGLHREWRKIASRKLNMRAACPCPLVSQTTGRPRRIFENKTGCLGALLHTDYRTVRIGVSAYTRSSKYRGSRQ